MKINDVILDEIVSYLKSKYFVHTIILYGSRARNEDTEISDYDILAIRESGHFERDCEPFKGFYLDAFIYSEGEVVHPDNYMIRIKDGLVLCQKNKQGENLLDNIDNMFKKGPPKTPEWEKKEIIGWTGKMFSRAKVNDIEGNFRLHWLLHDILECYFKLRDQWYFGPKHSFKWLKENDPQTYQLFAVSLKQNSNSGDIQYLINRVLNFN